MSMDDDTCINHMYLQKQQCCDEYAKVQTTLQYYNAMWDKHKVVVM